MEKYDMAQHFIQQANPHLADVNALLPGMKITIPSSSKVVQTTSAGKQQQTIPVQTDNSVVTKRKILYAHAHRRPMGETIAYDQQLSKPSLRGREGEQFGPVISGICCHCHQPIYSPF